MCISSVQWKKKKLPNRIPSHSSEIFRVNVKNRTRTVYIIEISIITTLLHNIANIVVRLKMSCFIYIYIYIPTRKLIKSRQYAIVAKDSIDAYTRISSYTRAVEVISIYADKKQAFGGQKSFFISFYSFNLYLGRHKNNFETIVWIQSYTNRTKRAYSLHQNNKRAVYKTNITYYICLKYYRRTHLTDVRNIQEEDLCIRPIIINIPK